MVLLEIIGIVGFAGLISAWAVWIYPALRGEREISPKTYIYTQGQCSLGLLANDRDTNRIKEWKEHTKESETNKDLEESNHSQDSQTVCEESNKDK